MPALYPAVNCAPGSHSLLVIKNFNPLGQPFTSETTIDSVAGGGIAWQYTIASLTAEYIVLQLTVPNTTAPGLPGPSDPPTSGDITITLTNPPPGIGTTPPPVPIIMSVMLYFAVASQS